MFYTIYKMINKIDGKIYIGKHQTKDLNDGYMGSGKYLRRAIDKYGIENFEKEILHIFDDEDEMNAKEAELVTDEFVKEDSNYNLCPGGHGGFGYIRQLDTYDDQVKRGRVAANITIKEKYGVDNISQTENFKNEASIRMKEEYNSGKRKSHFCAEVNKEMSMRAQSESAKKKRKETRKKNNFQVGKNNSQYGTTWVWKKENGNKKIKKDELEHYIDRGWERAYKPGYKVPIEQNGCRKKLC